MGSLHKNGGLPCLQCKFDGIASITVISFGQVLD